jgi:ankyrin repeat protein
MLMLMMPGVSAKHAYGIPKLNAFLYLTCEHDDGSQYAEALLEAGAQPNSRRGKDNNAPIHIAAGSAGV